MGQQQDQQLELHPLASIYMCFGKVPPTAGKKLMQREMKKGEINEKSYVVQEIV